MSPVLTRILRPFTSIDASSTPSGPDLRGLAREDVIFPNAVVPAFKTTFPLTETSCAIFASKLLPTTACELMRLTVVTVNIVPAGIVAPFSDESAKHAYAMVAPSMNFFRIISILTGYLELHSNGTLIVKTNVRVIEQSVSRYSPAISHNGTPGD